MLTVENNQAPSSKHNPKVGDFYARVEDPQQIYVVSEHYHHGSVTNGLINITTGQPYTDSKTDINDIFGNFSSKFYLITKDIKIVID